MMRAPIILSCAVIALMGVLMANILVHDGMDHGVGFDVFMAGAGDPWQLFINNDLVTGLWFMCGWMIFREKGHRMADILCWVWMVMWWGNIIVAAYVLRAAWQARGEWSRFFLGRRAGELRPIAFAVPVRMLFAALAIGVAVWTGLTVRGTGVAPMATAGLVLGFAPIVLTLLLLAAPARPAAQ